MTFEDPEGSRHELAVVDTPDAPLVAEHPEIPAELALRGFDGVRAFAADPEASRGLLEEALGSSLGARTRGRLAARVAAASTPTTTRRPSQAAGERGPCTTSRGPRRWRSTRNGANARTRPGCGPTPVIDRFWFRSIYFREPSGVLFEIATLGPGFAVDEDPEHLGESLVLPPAFEHMREQIEPILTPSSAARGQASARPRYRGSRRGAERGPD